LRYTSTSSFDSSVLTGVNERLELGRLVEEDVSLEPVRDGVLDLVGGELRSRDVEDKVHFLQCVAAVSESFKSIEKRR
jgi:hypothetical protein